VTVLVTGDLGHDLDRREERAARVGHDGLGRDRSGEETVRAIRALLALSPTTDCRLNSFGWTLPWMRMSWLPVTQSHFIARPSATNGSLPSLSGPFTGSSSSPESHSISGRPERIPSTQSTSFVWALSALSPPMIVKAKGSFLWSALMVRTEAFAMRHR
jgi:hypothetical protein